MINRNFIFTEMLSYVESALGVTSLDVIVSKIDIHSQLNPFIQIANVLNLRYCVSEESLCNIPTSGPLLILANHPTGGADPILLMKTLLNVRQDIKILSHVWFKRFQIFNDYSIFVNPQAREIKEFKMNEIAIDNCINWVKSGKALLVFPAGEVAYLERRTLKIVEPEWKSGLAKIVAHTNPQILPVNILGKNSKFYYMFSFFFRKWRFLLLAKELLNKSNQVIQIQINPSIDEAELSKLSKQEEMISFLRMKTLKM